MKTQPRILHTEGAAAYLDTTPAAIYQLVFQKRLPCRKQGSRLIFLKAELDVYIDSLMVSVPLGQPQAADVGGL